MGPKDGINPVGAQRGGSELSLLGGAVGVSSLRKPLLASASPSAPQAQLSAVNQIISTAVTGPIRSDGGAITVTSTGSIAGGPDGVDALTYSITTLTNSGAINGAIGATSAAGAHPLVKRRVRQPRARLFKPADSAR